MNDLSAPLQNDVGTYLRSVSLSSGFSQGRFGKQRLSILQEAVPVIMMSSTRKWLCHNNSHSRQLDSQQPVHDIPSHLNTNAGIVLGCLH